MHHSREPKRLLILGSTGSIGRQTIEVVRNLNDARAGENGESASSFSGSPMFEIVGLAAGSNAVKLFEQARELGVSNLALAEGSDGLPSVPEGAILHTGPAASAQLIEDMNPDVVLSAIVGVAGLPATMAALERGIDVALANKEALVAAGSVVTAAARRSGAALLPVDSEHAALWMCLNSAPEGFRFPPFNAGEHVSRITLTASGGALRDWSKEELAKATPDDALAHPNWAMGAKVTLDTATLMNKAFELVEAHWFFDLPAEKLCAVVHPQSIVHAIADFADGSSVAQLGLPDMRTPIQYALTAPSRPRGLVEHVSFADCRELTFEQPDRDRFPALSLGHRIAREGGTSGAIVNAANEAAGRAFFDRLIPFPAVYELTAEALDAIGTSPLRDLDDAMEADAEARRFVKRSMEAYASTSG